VVVIDPKNAEAHYDLGFLYLNQVPPDWAAVQREWNTVIELDPTSPLAQTVQSHLDSLAQSSMIPGSSPAASPALSTTPAPSASPAASSVP
ncbi:MAG: tetratricopeptide repeat protein, partial [Chloroflexi bacterium]|nr:tetratricopeptide repeat protein [Chloroflexota bacterium]